MTPAELQQLTDLNLEINAMPYIELPGKDEPDDLWIDAPVDGFSFVCRDYVLAKHQRLRESGWNPLNLRVILCYTEPTDYGYHAVAGVIDGKDIWILDSRADFPYLKKTPSPNGYTWDRIQLAGSLLFEPLA